MNEEEKKVINIFIEKCYKYDESVEIKGISVGEEYRMLNTVCKALNLIEKLQKENEELKADNYELNNRINDLLDNISVQKVKDKIEELKAQYKTALEGNSTEAFILKCQITILQELIEEREEK